MFCLPSGYKTDNRADTYEALPLKTYTFKVLTRHGNHGNTKNITSSVYDCTVEDVEYIYNKLSIHIFNSKRRLSVL